MARSDSTSPALPDLAFEQRAMLSGARVIAGVDEVGRGPLAGPVVVAAVVLDPRRVPQGLNDSKLLKVEARAALFEEILATATVSVVAAPPSIIARLNILHATLWAMRRAVLGLSLAPDHVLVDGNIVPKGLPCAGQAVIGGDGLSVSIAAASIVAKVTRDRMCEIMHDEEPHYGFASHKGYAAPAHMKALTAHGPGRYHRMDFAPCIAAAERRAAVA
jgi:ribonuclease HII